MVYEAASITQLRIFINILNLYFVIFIVLWLILIKFREIWLSKIAKVCDFAQKFSLICCLF